MSILGEGLFQFNPETDQLKHFKHESDNIYSLSDNDINPIYEDRSGTLWIGTQKGYLNKFDRNTEEFTRYQVVPDGLNVNFIFEDSRNLLWFGSWGDILVVISMRLIPYRCISTILKTLTAY